MKEGSVYRVDQENIKLFFINLGGYKPDEFDEFHYKILIAAPDKNTAIKRAKQTTFFIHTSFKNAQSHIDDKFGVDVDDIFEIKDILPLGLKEKYKIQLTKVLQSTVDPIHLGYMKLDKL